MCGPIELGKLRKLTLANANMRQVFDELGYGDDVESMNIPIDEFIGKNPYKFRKFWVLGFPEESVPLCTRLLRS